MTNKVKRCEIKPLMILKYSKIDFQGKKNAPNLADRGKSTFSEGGGDNWCVQKSTTVRNCTGVFVAMQHAQPHKM
jgi:hypothetical protein